MKNLLMLVFVVFTVVSCDNEIPVSKEPIKWASFSSSDGKFSSTDPEAIASYVDGSAEGCGKDSNGKCYCCAGQGICTPCK